MEIIAKIALSLVRGYLVKLASKEFMHWAFFKIAEAVVENTETKQDDEWLEKIRETVEDED